MARDKLIPKPPDTDRRDPRKQFSDLASRVFSTPKSEINEREKRWQQCHKKPKS
jgi:hypothetical protein